MGFERIALLSHEMTYSGAPNSLLNVARLLRANGYFVKIYTLCSGEFVKEFHRYGFRVYYFDESMSESAKAEFATKYDIFIANTIFCLNVAYSMQNYMPTILYIREAQNLPEIIRKCNFNENYLNSIKNAICVSEYAYEFISKRYSVKNLKILHNFLIKPKLFFRHKNICRNGIVQFLISATIEERKGIKLAIQAFDSLPHDIKKSAVLHIAGKMPDWSQQYWEDIDFNSHANIQYHGEITKRSKMLRLINNSNVVIVPSYDESCSLSALEGAMFGKALIVSENVGCKYIVKNDGLVFKTGSIKSLKSAIIEIIKQKDKLVTMGDIAYKMFSTTSSSTIYKKNFIDILSEMKQRKE